MLRRRPRGSVPRGRQAPSYASAGSLCLRALFGCYAFIGGGGDVAGLDRVPTCRLRHRRRSSASGILRSGRTQATMRVFQECGARRIALRSMFEGHSARGPAPAECPGPAALPSSPPPSASSDAARPRRSPQRPPHLRRPKPVEAGVCGRVWRLRDPADDPAEFLAFLNISYWPVWRLPLREALKRTLQCRRGAERPGHRKSRCLGSRLRRDCRRDAHGLPALRDA